MLVISKAHWVLASATAVALSYYLPPEAHVLGGEYVG